MVLIEFTEKKREAVPVRVGVRGTEQRWEFTGAAGNKTSYYLKKAIMNVSSSLKDTLTSEPSACCTAYWDDLLERIAISMVCWWKCVNLALLQVFAAPSVLHRGGLDALTLMLHLIRPVCSI